MSSTRPWSVAAVPASYGHVDDTKLCRHVWVARKGATVDGLKRAVLKAFEDQYKPSEIRLFARKYDDEPKALTTDRQVHLLLSYGPDWVDLGGHQDGHQDDHSILLVVSALDEAESELLVMPAAHSVAKDTLLRDLSASCGSVKKAEPLLRRLAKDETGLFDPLPFPGHIDDWLAQYREALQSTSEMLALGCAPKAGHGGNAICIQPLLLDDVGAGTCAADGEGGVDGIDQAWLFARLREYLAAFFWGTPVILLPAVTMKRGNGARSVTLLGKTVAYREHCPGNGEPQPQGQLSAPQLLRAIAPKGLRGRKGPSGRKTQGYGGVLPPEGFCVLGVTFTDIFCDDDDVFTGGLADMNSHAGLLSFHRYLRVDRATGQPASGAMWRGAACVGRDLVLARACKTAAHEVMHMYGIGHCLHRACLMNGAGHLLEDFAAPAHLCPVDLSKLVAALGASCELVPRYRALLAFCEEHAASEAAIAAQAVWVRRALESLGESGGAIDGGAAAANPPVRPPSSKRPRAGPTSPLAANRQAGKGGDNGKGAEEEEDEDDEAPLMKRVRAKLVPGN